MSEGKSKARILYIYRMLVEQTDESHYLTIQQIINQLQECGISAFRKTVISDIEQLVEFGMDIVCVKSSQNRYHINKHDFTLAELKLLVDAVECSQFITLNKSAELIEKLSNLTSCHNADELCRGIYLSRRSKSENEEMYEAVDSVHKAINRKRQITFRYYEYDGNKNRVLRNNGEQYQLSPYGMTWEDGKYYVIGYSIKHSKIVTFRVDRMCDTQICDYPAIPKPDEFDVSEFVKKAFRMYDDGMVTVTLKCKNEVMKLIIDRFGIDVHTEPSTRGYFKATVDVYASQTFFGWVFQFGGAIQIVKPASVKRRYVEMARIVCER